MRKLDKELYFYGDSKKIKMGYLARIHGDPAIVYCKNGVIQGCIFLDDIINQFKNDDVPEIGDEVFHNKCA